MPTSWSNTQAVSYTSWFAAYNGAVTGAGTLGGMKGYLATVTTSEEATL